MMCFLLFLIETEEKCRWTIGAGVGGGRANCVLAPSKIIELLALSFSYAYVLVYSSFGAQIA